MLKEIREQLTVQDALLLGTDLVKDESILIPAYDDAQGVTAKFNKNILCRLNRELGANFDLTCFRHVACWNPERSCIQIYLESLRPQIADVPFLNLQVKFEKGERIHTENSYKYTLPTVKNMLKAAGLSLGKTWYDERKWFALHLARAT